MKKTFLIVAVLFACANTFCQSYVPEWKDAKMKVKPVTDLKAYAFNVSDVKLLDGPFTEAMKSAVNYLLKIEPDRLLSDFRVHS